eukprot:scpid68589/ scgid10091/ 
MKHQWFCAPTRVLHTTCTYLCAYGLVCSVKRRCADAAHGELPMMNVLSIVDTCIPCAYNRTIYAAYSVCDVGEVVQLAKSARSTLLSVLNGTALRNVPTCIVV